MIVSGNGFNQTVTTGKDGKIEIPGLYPGTYTVKEIMADYYVPQETKKVTIKAACITQTLHFLLKEDVAHDYAIKLVNDEVRKYKEQLEKNRTQYKILSETTQDDGSIMIEVKKQYNTSPVGHYLD